MPSQKFKSHKTVEQIARKHRLDVSFIQKQLDMGEPIEHEHTKDHDLARDIALQHLDEIPDYYTRLKKMEAGAKKHHKKFNDVKEEDERDMDVPMLSVHIEHEKRYCQRCKKIQLRSECKYGSTCWDIFSIPVKLKEDLRKWFDKNDPEGNWRRFNTKGEPVGPCAREPGEPKPKCLSNEKAAKMTRNQIVAAVKRKREADPVSNRKGKGGEPIMSSNKIKEEHSNEETRYCPLCDKRETRSECSYGEKAWDKVSVKDEEYSMARGELETIMNAAKRLKNTVGKGEGNLEAWVQSKITKAADYIDTAADYIDSGEAKMQEACWVGYKQVGMKKKGKKMVPNCVPEEVSATIDKSKHREAQKSAKIGNLARNTTNPGEKVAAEKKSKGLKLFGENISLTDKILWEIEAENLREENKPTDPKLWSKAKSLARQKFDVYPSAYANGWASKWYKSKGGGWKSANESVTIEDANGNTFVEIIDLIKPEPIISEATRLQAQTGNIIAVTLQWRGKYYALRVFFPQSKLPSRKEVTDELQKVYPGSVVIHHSISEFTPGQPMIQPGPHGGNFAKSGSNKNYVKPMGEEIELEEDWQKVNRQDKTDGLSPAAVKAYRRENPGSKLQTAVTEKNPTGKRKQRRSDFCSRMKGMKSKLTSAKTARDPDSNINKALRRWNCS
jgi:hypothetical protein